MKKRELVEYSTVISIMESQIAILQSTLRSTIGACVVGFDAEAVKALAEKGLKISYLRMDFQDVEPEGDE